MRGVGFPGITRRHILTGAGRCKGPLWWLIIKKQWYVQSSYLSQGTEFTFEWAFPRPVVCVAYCELLEWKLQGWWFSGKRSPTKIKERTLGHLVCGENAVISAPSSSWLLLYLDTGNINISDSYVQRLQPSRPPWQSHFVGVQMDLTCVLPPPVLPLLLRCHELACGLQGVCNIALRVLRVSRLMGYASRWRLGREAPDSCPDCFLSVT